MAIVREMCSSSLPKRDDWLNGIENLSGIGGGRCGKPFMEPKLQVLRNKTATLVEALSGNIFPLRNYGYLLCTLPRAPIEGSKDKIVSNTPAPGFAANTQ